MMTPYEDIAKARVITSSVAPNGVRLDTLHVRLWRPLLAELNTHRVFSRNAGSSRAIPIMTVLDRNEIYVPKFRKNKPGMQPGEHLDDLDQITAERIWIDAANHCRDAAKWLSTKTGPNVHKQWPNRMLEWFSWVDVLISSTNWSNFNALRNHDAAQDEIKALAIAIADARADAVPHTLKPGEWHLPYITESDRDQVRRLMRSGRALPREVEQVMSVLDGPKLSYLFPTDKVLLAISAARCCRLSYAKFDGSSAGVVEDMVLFLQLALARPLHASPLEHQGRGLSPVDDSALQGNLIGYAQFRKHLPAECL